MGASNSKYHSGLAGYFLSKPLYQDETIQKKPNTRKLVEHPWQQLKTDMFKINTLSNE
jgi:hypothetical protein